MKGRQSLHAFLYFLTCKHISSSVAINKSAHILKAEHFLFELSFKMKENKEEKENIMATLNIVPLQ